MSIYTLRSKKHRRIWEDHHNACIFPGMHVHHIDGNHHNNDPENLLLCSPREHYEIHVQRGDYGAAILIWKHCLTGNEVNVSAIASKRLKQTHQEWKQRDPIEYSNWQRDKGLGKKRTDAQKEAYRLGAQKRLSDPKFREKLSVSCKGKRKVRTCPHCNRVGAGGNMGRYHFENCKLKNKEREIQ